MEFLRHNTAKLVKRLLKNLVFIVLKPLRSAPCKLNNEKHEQTPWTIKVLKKEPKELFSECQK